MTAQATEPDGKSTALLAYIPFVGFLIGYAINKEDKHPFATWHIKNMFGLFVMFFVAMVFQNKINGYIGDIIFLLALGLWIYSFVMAYFNKKQGVPFLDQYFQEWFKFLN